MVFEPRLRLAGFEPRLRLKLKAQPIELEEPVHKISLEIPVIQYSPLFLKLLLLDTKIKFNYSFQHLLCIIYI
jgi:hypothetical protein